jgi:hypothetical protein
MEEQLLSAMVSNKANLLGMAIILQLNQYDGCLVDIK